GRARILAAMDDAHRGVALVEREARIEIGHRQRDVGDAPVDTHENRGYAHLPLHCLLPMQSTVEPVSDMPVEPAEVESSDSADASGAKTRVKVHISVPADEFDKAIDAAFRKLAREVRVPGFRPGKAPRRLLEARLGTELAREQALQDALPQYYVDAINEHEVDVIAPPEIEITA